MMLMDQGQVRRGWKRYSRAKNIQTQHYLKKEIGTLAAPAEQFKAEHTIVEPGERPCWICLVDTLGIIVSLGLVVFVLLQNDFF